MPRRPHSPRSTETDLLLRSRRRCALCLGFHGDVSLKVGQVAHVDGNARNTSLSNLAWLCLPHHDQYDGTTSQSKGVTQSELRAYRKALYQILDKLGDAWPGHMSGASAAATDGVPERVPAAPVPVSVEIFDRRIAIYRLVRGFLMDVVANADVDLARLRKFSQDTEEALFLLGHDVDGLIRELYLNGVNLRHVNQIAPLAKSDDERANFHAEWDRIMTWFLDQHEVVRTVFKRYLHL
jgi:hypothetical protein